MRYILAIFVSPLGVLLCRRPGHFIFNLVLWLCSLPLILFMGIGLIGVLACMFHALAARRMSSFDKRLDRLVNALQPRAVT